MPSALFASVASATASLSGVGVGLRACHYRDFLQHRPKVDWLEVHTENYLQAGGLDRHVLFELRKDYPFSLHGVGLGLGSAQGYSLAHLKRVAELVREVQPALVSEHLCWAASHERHLNDLLPLPLSKAALELICQRVTQAQDSLQRQILIENVSTYIRYRVDAMSEIEFLSEVARRTGCGILLDVNNLYVNQCNQDESALTAIDQVLCSAVGEIHLAGHLVTPGAVVDHHGAVVADAVWDLYRSALQKCGPVPTLIEWDTDIPALEILLDQADQARAIMAEFEFATELSTKSETAIKKADDFSENLCASGNAPLTFTPPILPELSPDSIASIQTEFTHALLAHDVPEVFSGDALQNQDRFARYRGNLVATWEKTLAAAFPVLQQLVGEEFFAALSRAFGHAHPSKDGDLNLFGAEFAGFLSSFEHVAQYPYFPDMARLEWAIHQAYYAADFAPDCKSLSIQDFMQFSAEKLDQSSFQLHPACQMLTSPWALVQLWEAHQTGTDAEFPQKLEQTSWVLVCRPVYKPQVISLSQAEFILLTAIRDGKTFGDALTLASEQDPEFEVVGSLQKILTLHLLQA